MAMALQSSSRQLGSNRKVTSLVSSLLLAMRLGNCAAAKMWRWPLSIAAALEHCDRHLKQASQRHTFHLLPALGLLSESVTTPGSRLRAPTAQSSEEATRQQQRRAVRLSRK